MGPFSYSKAEHAGSLLVESVDEAGSVSVGFVKSVDDMLAEADPDDRESYVVLGRVEDGLLVDERGKSHRLEEALPWMNWVD